MADASHLAWVVTGDPRWKRRAQMSAGWLLGDNDTGTVLYDEATGGTRDGLMAGSANENRGAESTIAGLATLGVAALCNSDSS